MISLELEKPSCVLVPIHISLFFSPVSAAKNPYSSLDVPKVGRVRAQQTWPQQLKKGVCPTATPPGNSVFAAGTPVYAIPHLSRYAVPRSEQQPRDGEEGRVTLAFASPERDGPTWQYSFVLTGP